MTARIDADAYFERIGYSGSRTASLDTLRAVHFLHPQAIAFENLNPLLGWPVWLDAASLERKLVHERRGGYCFEHNILLSHVLEALGFRVRGLAARVMWNAHDGATRPRSHMLLAVDLDDGPYIADVGFGGLTLTGPLRLEPGVEQSSPHEAFRLVRAGDELVLEVKLAVQAAVAQADPSDGWKALYRFGLQEQLLADYEVTNWYLSNHPQSQFVTTLIAARPDLDRRYALRNGRFTVHHLDGQSQDRLITDASELRDLLRSVFRVAVPETPAVYAALARIVAPIAVRA